MNIKRIIAGILALGMTVAFSACVEEQKTSENIRNVEVDPGNNTHEAITVGEGQTKRIASASGRGYYHDVQIDAKLQLEYDKNGIVRCMWNVNWPDGSETKAELFDGSLSRQLAKVVYDEDGSERTVISYAYDESGNLIHESEDMQSHRYSYDKDGNVIESTSTYYYNGEETVQRTYEYEFNEKGELIRETTNSDDGDNSVVSYKYDEKGRMIEKAVEGLGMGSFFYEYDESGNLVREDTYDGTYYYKYDQNGHMTEKTSGQSKTTYQYDDLGNLVTEIEYYSGEERGRTGYEYDTAGDLTQMTGQADSIKITITIEYEAVSDFGFENESLDDYIQYVQKKMYEIF